MRPIGQAGRLRPSDPLRPVQVRCWLRYSLVTKNQEPKTENRMSGSLPVASCTLQSATDNLRFVLVREAGPAPAASGMAYRRSAS